MSKQPKYTPAEIELAQTLFAEAKATGTLKAPRAIAALSTSEGYGATVTESVVSYLNYLRDARRALAHDARHKRPLRR